MSSSGCISFDAIDRGSCKVHTPTADEKQYEEGQRFTDGLAVASRMLGLDSNELSLALCFHTIQMRASGRRYRCP